MASLLSAATRVALERAFLAQDDVRLARQVLALLRNGVIDAMNALSGHPLEDEWKDAVQRGVQEHFSAAAGHLYVAVNTLLPDFHKVGKTGRVPRLRLAELNNEAVLGRLELVSAWQVYDRHFLEKAAHRALGDQPRHKEFFKVPWADACARVERAIDMDAQLLGAAGFEVTWAPYRASSP